MRKGDKQMNKEFFCVSFDYGDDFYFHSLERARDFLWTAYRERCPRETEEEQLKTLDELMRDHMIQSIGYIYFYEFED